MWKRKKMMSLLLAAMLILTVIPASAFADGGDPPPQDSLAVPAYREVWEEAAPPEILYVPETLRGLEESQDDPNGQAEDGYAYSLLPPVSTEYVSLDLSGRTQAELKAIPVSELLAMMGISPAPGEKIAWGYWIEEYEYYPGSTDLRRLDDAYHIVRPDGVVDMRPVYSSGSYSFNIFVGKGVQLDYDAVKYQVNVSVTPIPESYEFDAVLYTDDSPRAKIFQFQREENTMYSASTSNGIWTYTLQVPTNYPLTDEYCLMFYWNPRRNYEYEYSGLDVTVYEGHHSLETVGDAAAAAGLWASDISVGGGYKAVYGDTPREFTLVFSAGGKRIAAQPVRFVGSPMSSQLRYRLLNESGSSYSGTISSSTQTIATSAPGEYKTFKLSFTDGATGATDIAKITGVRIDGADVTAQVTGGGYTIADRSRATPVTIAADGRTYNVTIPAMAQDEFQYIGSSDVYFRIEGAEGIQDYFVVPHAHDTYYYNGYQTVLINGTDAGLADLAPTFWNGDPDIYSGGQKQISGVSTQDFSGGRVQYTAKATNNADLKNYFVAFIPKTETEAELFVNGPSGNGADGSNERYVRFDSYYGSQHDIFIANTGEAPLSGLSATLENARSIRLDDWYTVGGAGNDALNAFSRTGNIGYTYNGIDSAAKIRLVPDGDGDIDGILTISADGVDPYVIHLTGRAGNPKVNTTQDQVDAYPAVKFVPYSFLVTTDNEYDWTTVRFSRSAGTLPPGLTLRQNGEIYGIPTEPGIYTFTVTAQFSGRVQFPANSQEYTITVLDNTDENVDRTVDTGYSIEVRVPAVVGTNADHDFQLEGAFNEFMDFYLDGNKMAADTDYMAEDGSTKITIKAQTFNDAGAGTHTIAAEFRVNGDAADLMKRAAQNTIVQRGGTGGGGGTGGDGSYLPPAASGRPGSTSSRPTAPTVSKPVAEIFTDLSNSAWYIGDVQWAYDNGYMLGTGDNRFQPNARQNQAVIFSALARLADVNLHNYADKTSPDIKTGEWYTNAAQWAKSIGLTANGFNPDGIVTRGDMAVIIVKYFKWLGVGVDVDSAAVTFADADFMTPEQSAAFTILYKIKIFYGASNTGIQMNALNETSRAELSALLKRLNAYITAHKK
jgi:hypothetical protein